ncbi:5'-methylthioadenosine/S-adenosylhomocysteine nucleosidase, partial [Paenibacillus sp. OT2-17]|nr:5'-methylthioadenosine/S-adenosylhomocysteine nucleosidase [Paenibacillus sp. OT2-17]
SQAERAHFIRSQFPEAKVTDMEGAAVVQTAYQFGVPFLAVRSLSDLAGVEAADSFDSNLDLAAANSAAVVVALVAAYDRDKL